MELCDTPNDRVKVTVGMCVKDSEDTIEKAIVSVLEQDFPHNQMELIIVDGNSRDSTLRIVKESLMKTDLKARIFAETSGLGTARQLVVNNATGDYIVWVDADMILPKSYVFRQVAFMENHPKAGIASGKYAVFIGQGIAADLENIVYAVDSVYSEKGATRFGYLPGTEGSIFRVQAIRRIGGFDVRMNGAGEDTDIIYRMSQNGWQIAKTKEMFAESTRQSWSSLWSQYVWYGRGGHFVFHKNSNAISLWKMTPLVGLLAGLLRSPKAYLLTHKKAILLLPIHYVYKRIAWTYGFMNAHLDGYGHFNG